MKHYEEIQQLLSRKERIAIMIEATKSLGYWGNKMENIAILDSNNGRNGLDSIRKLIGNDKLNTLTIQFENLLLAELYQVREATDQELSHYQIVKE